jgi:hypothetical protein
MGTVSRLQLFTDIVDEIGDGAILTASEDGAVNTFISTDEMLYPDGSFDGREVWYATSADAISANNAGTRRVVASTVYQDGKITVYPDWPAITQEGDVVIILPNGMTCARIHRKINQLIRRVRSQLAIEAASTPAAFDATSPVLTIPSGWDYLLGVQIERNPTMVGVWDDWIGEVYSVATWDSPKTVTIKPKMRYVADGKRLRLIGANDLSELTLDSDTTTAPDGWLAKTAAFEMIEAAALQSGDVATAFTYGELLKAQATLLEQTVAKRYRGPGARIDLRR